MGRETT